MNFEGLYIPLISVQIQLKLRMEMPYPEEVSTAEMITYCILFKYYGATDTLKWHFLGSII